jgi:hypothetical protein
MSVKTVMLIFGIVVLQAIEIQHRKRNLYVPQNSQFLTNVYLERKHTELIPTTLSLRTTVANSIPKFGDNFDYFPSLGPDDLKCYRNAIQSEYFLFPCSFLTNRNSEYCVPSAES